MKIKNSTSQKTEPPTCTCYYSHVQVGYHRSQGMICSRCGKSRECPDCGETEWLLGGAEIECGNCLKAYPRPATKKEVATFDAYDPAPDDLNPPEEEEEKLD